MNHNAEEANLLSAFNDKPLIIDFWFIRCAPCLEAMLRLDSLQKVYHNQFNILLATSEKEEDVKAFFQRNKKFRDFNHPIVYSAHSNSNLKKLFPHTGEPHEVWIGKEGIVKAITSSYEITPENIQKFLLNENLNIPEKKDILDEKYAMGGQPLLMTDEERNAGKRKLYYSWIGAADPQVPSLVTGQLNIQTNEQKIICQNTPITGLYQIAYRTYRSKTQIENEEVIKVTNQSKDSLNFTPDSRTQKNLFCYEIFMRDTTDAKIRTRMQKELDDFFNLKSEIKQGNIPYYILSRLKKDTLQIFKPEVKTAGYIQDEGDTIYIRNVAILSVVRNKLYNKLQHSIINETGYNGKIDLAIPKTANIETIRHALNNYGLDINLEMRPGNIVILKDAH
ncbi:hypothetical protein SAMN04488128_10878 [Chitinophaga eiseniae]|uniref:Thiol-disulfide isomerase or thioredoxin n=2 Tax=Chitinophaga eiseniae TaxID=634771 RepID=A0A1T4U2U1_9BACT|nr:hypothetical protein SAMN04488128_10878 [Chitinophaga eiseniae]